jgi:hypothetical protein
MNGMPPTDTANALCTNCGANLHGEYCSQCGQRRAAPVRSLWHLLTEVAEDLTHSDSRIWRTLGYLAVRPGFLMREYRAGRRARYLPPFRLYLALSVVFFALAVTTSPPRAYVVSLDPAHLGATSPVSGSDAVHLCRSTYGGPGARPVQEFIRTRCPELLRDGGRSLAAAFEHNLPRAMFLFVPLVALFMKAMYWRPRRYYVEHWLFLLYLQSFAFLLIIVGIVVGYVSPRAVDKWLTIALWLYAGYYLVVSMRAVYQQSQVATGFKVALLGLAYVVCALGVLAGTALYSVLTL